MKHTNNKKIDNIEESTSEFIEETRHNIEKCKRKRRKDNNKFKDRNKNKFDNFEDGFRPHKSK